MRAAVVVEPGRLEVRRARVPEPQRGEVLVRIEGCGVCGSSLPLWEGRPWFSYPFEAGRPGHEAWGFVEERGPETGGPEHGSRVAFLSQHSFAEWEASSCRLSPHGTPRLSAISHRLGPKRLAPLPMTTPPFTRERRPIASIAQPPPVPPGPGGEQRPDDRHVD
jgi:NADPH:quinone reductase-like Zn-dependent oxidoreductase